jgi:hypothetical protein
MATEEEVPMPQKMKGLWDLTTMTTMRGMIWLRKKTWTTSATSLRIAKMPSCC